MATASPGKEPNKALGKNGKPLDAFPDAMFDGDISQILGSLAPGGFWQRDRYYAQCPLHQDRDWSFCYEKKNRNWRCQSGCGGGDIVAMAVRLWSCGFQAALDRMEGLLGGRAHQIVRSYPYVDADGRFLYEVLRYEPKAFCARRPNTWYWTLEDTPRVPYRLPEVIAANEILILEGEKDCETARTWGFVATTNAEGGGRWKGEFATYFRGKRIHIVSDADETGRGHARQVAGTLVPVAKSVKLVELIGAKDLTEWIERGGTREQLLELFANAHALTPEDVAGWWQPNPSLRLARGGESLLSAKWVTVPESTNGSK